MSAKLPEERLVSAFDRLRDLLSGLAPGAEPVELQIGELRTDDEPELSTGGWTRYPPLGGTLELRNAYQNWLHRRFGAVGISAEPTPGSKQALGLCLAAALRRGKRVLVPNPFYPTYQHATVLQGGEPVYYDAAACDPRQAFEAALSRGQVTAMLLCHPGAPYGLVYSREVLAGLQSLCATQGVWLLVDETYIDSHAGTPPEGYLSHDAKLENVLVFHSLSKRAAAPGLRSGFVSGDAKLVGQYARSNRHLGVSAAVPICVAAAKLWEDDRRVKRLNARIASAWGSAQRHLADWPGFSMAASGFFLWLPVGPDEAFAKAAWAKAGLRVMPGSYLAETVSGFNPGAGFARIALVHESAVMDGALARLGSLKPVP